MKFFLWSPIKFPSISQLSTITNIMKSNVVGKWNYLEKGTWLTPGILLTSEIPKVLIIKRKKSLEPINKQSRRLSSKTRNSLQNVKYNKSSRILACLFGIQNEILYFLILIHLLLKLCYFSRWAKIIIHFGSFTFFISPQQMFLIAIFLIIHVFFTKPFILVFLFLYLVLIMT
jgi:hypothetical protein